MKRKIEPKDQPKIQAAKKEDRPRYRKIDPRIWNDYKFNQLSTTGQFLFLYLLTHSNLTSIGLLKVKKEALAHERDWNKECIWRKRGWRECVQTGSSNRAVGRRG